MFVLMTPCLASGLALVCLGPASSIQHNRTTPPRGGAFLGTSIVEFNRENLTLARALAGLLARLLSLLLSRLLAGLLTLLAGLAGFIAGIALLRLALVVLIHVFLSHENLQIEFE
jgi:hypothetical protein